MHRSIDGACVIGEDDIFDSGDKEEDRWQVNWGSPKV